MIAKIEGTLEAVTHDRALVRLAGGITLEALVPAFTAAALADAVDHSITLHTYAFFEGQSQGATLLPRLAGFARIEDRRFYELFVTCKGIGHRRALRAMTLPVAQIAGAIEDRNLTVLQSLPEIGKRTAETIVATLRGKVSTLAAGTGTDSGTGMAAQAGASGLGGPGGLAGEALSVLVQLGERRNDAAAWIDRILAREDPPPPEDVQSLITEVYQLKGRS